MILALALLLACETAPPAPTAEAASAPAPVAAAPAAAAPGGKVLEVLESGGYTYLRLDLPEGETWAAVPQAPVAVGDEARLANVSVMTDFTSRSLGRTFDRILFGTLDDGSAPAAPRTTAAAPAMGAPHGGAPAAATPPAPVSPAEGADAHTVAGLYTDKATLAGQTVTVRGAVTKFTPSVMGKNWVHIADGTGADETGDLTVTTQDLVAVGDVVTVHGAVATEVDLGMGYHYAVMIEDAQVRAD